MRMMNWFRLAAATLGLLLWADPSNGQGDGNLHIYCINVGKDSGCFYKQGDSTLIVSPTGTTMLIDAGAAGACGADEVLATLGRVLPAGG